MGLGPSKGSHAVFEHPKIRGLVVIPVHNGDLPVGLVKSMLKAAKVKDD